jgi:transmembrane 9 superfamily protein 1
VTTYNGNPRYKVDLTPHVEGVLDAADYEVTFTYGVTWYEDATPHQKRMVKYADGGFVPKNLEIHWLSIINSFVLVILLTVFLGIILVRVLKNDFSRYMSLEDELEFQEEESGWKLIHGDVFRPPPFVSVFAAFLGGGAQLFVIGGSLICLALMGFFAHHNRGSIATAGIMLYAVTSCVSGFVSARWYRQLGGTNWVWNIVLSSVIFAGPLFFVFAWVNTTALTMKSTAALPVSTVMIIMALFLLVSFPLTVFGGIAGRNTAGDFDAPCRTKLKPRQIPTTPWFRSAIAQLCVAGFLPFSAIYIEMHYIFAAVWGHKVYTFFGILALAVVMLLIVTSFVTISLTYFQLVGEDHTWWWRAFLSGGSTGGFIYAYCFYYFSQHSEMDGFMQTSFYFGYMALASYGFFMMLGFVGFTSSLWFVKTIYRTIKVE